MAKADLGRISREAARIMGPAFLVSVAYMDPGNWATAIEAGSRFGYQLVWVVVLSNLIAILLQTLAARLGLVTGKHLAQVCREAYPPVVCILLWVLAEVSIVALDLTMVLGTAIGLNLLLGWPMLPCILLTGLDALLLLLLVPRQGVRTSEQLTVGLLVMVVGCFLVDLCLSKPPLRQVVGGLVPLLSRDSVYAAVCLLGANVMPHNFLLHSALVAGQARGAAGTGLRQLCLYNFLDIAAALGLALLVNVAVLLVAAATFHQAGIVVETLQDAHDLMESLLSSRTAPVAFGLALLCAGQLSTFTGTIAGQVVLRGFLNVHISTWLRRVATRSAAVLPAALLQYAWGDKATYKYLLVAQVVLALQLPFTLVPLIKATSSARLMGPHRNSALVAAAAWASLGLVFVANLGLFVAELWPGAAFVPQVVPGAPDSPLHQYLDNVAGLAWARPGRFLLLLGLIVAAAGLLALQLWIIVTPLSPHVAPLPLLLRQTGGEEEQQQHGGWDDTSKTRAAAPAADKKVVTGTADGDEGDTGAWPAKYSAATAAAADWPGLVAGSGRVGRPVVVGWNVPGVREWLMGAQQAADGAGEGPAGSPREEAGALLGAAAASRDEAVGWSHDVQLAVHSRTAAAPQHATLQPLFDSQQQLADHQEDEQQQQQQQQQLVHLQEADDGQSEPLCTLVEPQQHSTTTLAKEVHLSQRKLSWQLQQQDEASAPSVHEAALPTAKQQQQQQQQEEQQQQQPPDCWDDLHLDSISLLAPTATTSMAPPSSPGGASAASSSRASFSMLGADREVWLDTWHEPSCLPRAASSSSSISLTSTDAAASTEPLMRRQQQQQQRLPGQQPSSSSRAGAAAASTGSLQSAAGRSSAGSAAAAAAAAGSLGKSGRRLLAAVLEGFWAAYYDTHGSCTGAAAAAAAVQSSPAASAGRSSSAHHLQQPRKKQALSSWPAAGSSEQQPAAEPPSCCRCGAAGTSNGWCSRCGVALLQHLQGCLAELMAVPGAAELLLPASLAQGLQQQRQQQPAQTVSGLSSSADSTRAQPDAAAAAAGAGWSCASEGCTSAAGLLLDDAWQQLPGATQQLLQLVLPAAADGTLLQALSSSALQADQQQQQQQPQQSLLQQQQQLLLLQRHREQPLLAKKGAPSSQASEPSAAAAAAVPAVLWAWGVWCMVLLLVLAQVEVRPELWGRYAAVLNRLQGLLAELGPEAQQQQQQQQHKLRPIQAVPAPSSGRTSPAAAAAAVGEGNRPLPPVLPSPDERQALAGLLLALLAAVEAAVGGRKAPGGGGSVGSAFAKGKEICLSVVKRYRRRLLGSTASGPQQQQQQRWSGGGGSGSSSSRPRPGPVSGQRVAFGLLLGGLALGMPLMLAAGCGGSGMAAAGCRAVGAVWRPQRVAAVVLQRL